MPDSALWRLGALACAALALFLVLLLLRARSQREAEKQAAYDRGYSEGYDRMIPALRRLVAGGAARELLRDIGQARRFAKVDPMERLPAREGVD